MNRKMTLTEPDHIRHAREASVRWLLEPSKKEKVKVSFYINPRTDVTYTSKQWIRVPFYDYDENNSCSRSSDDTVFKIIDSDGNVYDQRGKTVSEPVLNNGIYRSYKSFYLLEGDYYYYELESGIGKNLIEEPVKIEVREGMPRVINIDHTANEYRLYFEQEDVIRSYSAQQICNPHLADERYDYHNPYSNAEFISYGYIETMRFDAVRVCKIKSIIHNGKTVSHNLIYQNEDITETKYTNQGGGKWSSMRNGTPAEITVMEAASSSTYNLKIRPYLYDDISIYQHIGYTNPEDASHANQDPSQWIGAGICTLKLYSEDIKGFFPEGIGYKISAEKSGTKYDYIRQILAYPHYKSFPVKGGLLKGASYTGATWNVNNDEHMSCFTPETITETEYEAVCNASSAANLLTYAIKSLDDSIPIGQSMLIFDTDKKFKYETWWCDSSYNRTWTYAYDNPITSMYFSAVNTVNTIREEQNNE